MWFVWIVIGIVVFVVWVFYGSSRLCPSCGVELEEEFGYPGQLENHCRRCGWRGH